MDYGRTAISNPVTGHANGIDNHLAQYQDHRTDLIAELSDMANVEAMADQAIYAEELADRMEPYLANAERYYQAMQELATGQKTLTELRAKYGKHVADVVAAIRKINAQYESDLEVIDAKDRSALTLINQKRQNQLREIAQKLTFDLEGEVERHMGQLSKMGDNRLVAKEQNAIREQLRERRKAFRQRAIYGSIGPGSEPMERIPVAVNQNQFAPPSMPVTPSNQPRSGLFNGLFSRIAQSFSS